MPAVIQWTNFTGLFVHPLHLHSGTMTVSDSGGALCTALEPCLRAQPVHPMMASSLCSLHFRIQFAKFAPFASHLSFPPHPTPISHAQIVALPQDQLQPNTTWTSWYEPGDRGDTLMFPQVGWAWFVAFITSRFKTGTAS